MRNLDEIDVEIAEVERGNMAVLDPSAQRDRYQQFADTARGLLADFREVEANFRALVRELRERIAGWSGSKGQLLDEVLGDRDAGVVRRTDGDRAQELPEGDRSWLRPWGHAGAYDAIESCRLVAAADGRCAPLARVVGACRRSTSPTTSPVTATSRGPC